MLYQGSLFCSFTVHSIAIYIIPTGHEHCSMFWGFYREQINNPRKASISTMVVKRKKERSKKAWNSFRLPNEHCGQSEQGERERVAFATSSPAIATDWWQMCSCLHETSPQMPIVESCKIWTELLRVQCTSWHLAPGGLLKALFAQYSTNIYGND